jgi:hypothetical protein
VVWVRPSQVLALGAIKSPAARALLLTVEPRSDSERDALRKAIDRVSDRSVVGWARAPSVPLFATVPEGLEDVARAEAAQAGLEPTAEPGRLCFGSLHPDQVADLRCVFGPRLLLGQEPSLPDLVAVTAAVMRTAPHFRPWFACQGPLRYRFAVEGRTEPKGE